MYYQSVIEIAHAVETAVDIAFIREVTVQQQLKRGLQGSVLLHWICVRKDKEAEQALGSGIDRNYLF